MTVAHQALQKRIRNTTLWLTGCSVAFGVSVALAGYIGFSKSMRVMTAPAPGALVSSTIPLPPPVHDPRKPTVAVLLGNTFSEPTDVLGPYTMFAESGEYNVYTVAASRTVRTLTGGLDLVPHLSFEELAARLHGDPDIVVVPQIVDIRASINAPVVGWVRRQARGHALLFSWCTGAEVLAESGAIDGKTATAHWGDIDRLQRIYPRVHWQRGVRYVDGGTVLSTAGLTAGVDATLHLLARRNGAELATRVARRCMFRGLRLLKIRSAGNSRLARRTAIFLLNAGFHWPKPRLNVWLYDGVGELDLGAAVDVYGVSAAYQIHTQSTAASVESSHGIQFVPREQVRTVPPDGSQALRNDGSRQFAYVAAIEDLARRQDAWTARFAAKRLEIRTPLRIEGDSWSIRVVLAPLFIGCATLAFLFWLKRAVHTQRQTDLELRTGLARFQADLRVGAIGQAASDPSQQGDGSAVDDRGGTWQSKGRKLREVHAWRPRRSHYGEPVQWDTSDHN